MTHRDAARSRRAPRWSRALCRCTSLRATNARTRLPTSRPGGACQSRSSRRRAREPESSPWCQTPSQRNREAGKLPFRPREGHIPQGQTRDSRGKAKAQLLSDDGQEKAKAHENETQNDDAKFMSPESRRHVETSACAGLSSGTHDRNKYARDTHDDSECSRGWTLS